jgi:hypothetical protein
VVGGVVGGVVVGEVVGGRVVGVGVGGRVVGTGRFTTTVGGGVGARKPSGTSERPPTVRNCPAALHHPGGAGQSTGAVPLSWAVMKRRTIEAGT